MTESEFIKEKQKILKSMPDTICFTRGEAKSILEELEKYHAIEIKLREKYHANVDVKELTEYFIETIFEGEKHDGFCILTNKEAKMWEEYQSIGTVEECRGAVEKQKAQAPHIWGDGYSDGKPVYDMYDCPNCGTSYEIDGSSYKYCPECGQKLDLQGCFEGQQASGLEE